MDMHGRIRESNQALPTMPGHSETELAGVGVSSFTPPDDFGADLKLFTELVEGGRETYQIAISDD